MVPSVQYNPIPLIVPLLLKLTALILPAVLLVIRAAVRDGGIVIAVVAQINPVLVTVEELKFIVPSAIIRQVFVMVAPERVSCFEELTYRLPRYC